MKLSILIPVLLLLILGASGAIAESGKVTINSVAPTNVYAKDKITLSYEAEAGPGGDHLHLNVDGKRVDVIHQLKGNTTIDPLPAGKHHICLAVNSKAHMPTGVESCVDVTVR